MIRKAVTYSTFTIATIIVVLLFITSKSYIQLGLGVLLYPLLAYIALNIFPRREENHHEVTIAIPIPTNPLKPLTETKSETSTIKSEEGAVDVKDIDKRAFLKIIGAAGISVFIFSLFNKRSSLPFLGKGSAENVSLSDTKGNAIDPAQTQPLDGYQISEIDDGTVAYYGFINKEGSWYIMREDTQTSSFRYAKGKADFPKGWNSRERLKYDYFYNI